MPFHSNFFCSSACHGHCNSVPTKPPNKAFKYAIQLSKQSLSAKTQAFQDVFFCSASAVLSGNYHMILLVKDIQGFQARFELAISE